MKEKYDKLNISLGKKIKEYREFKNFTQEYLAKELDIATNHYGRIERGENSCTIANFCKICKILNTTPNSLLSDIIFEKTDDFYSYFKLLNIEDKLVMKEIAILLLSKYKNK